ncbi:MAG: head GIN domain-containing protein [Azoarcus sp.]|nr:head GIN domain-containing protein [Azoarcus sp.]
MSRRQVIKRPASIIPACLIGLVATLAGPAQAAGTVVEQRPVAGIRHVVMRATGELLVRQGPSESLQIEAEAHLLPKISSEVRNGTLLLAFNAPQITTSYPMVFRLTVKHLESLDSVASADVSIGALRADSFVLKLTGSGDIGIEALDAGRFETQLSGAGTVRVDDGQVGEQALRLQGSGDYVAGALESRKTSVTIDGSGNATVRASEQLVVRIAGSGDVRYYGHPRVDQIISGAGSVSRAEAP